MRTSKKSKQVLTEREEEIMALVSHGADNFEIANKMYISVHTAKAHVSAILKKLNAVNRTEATYIAMKSKILK